MPWALRCGPYFVGALNVIDQPILEKVHHFQRERGNRTALIFCLYVHDLFCQIVVLLFVREGGMPGFGKKPLFPLDRWPSCSKITDGAV